VNVGDAHFVLAFTSTGLHGDLLTFDYLIDFQFVALHVTRPTEADVLNLNYSFDLSLLSYIIRRLYTVYKRF